MGIGKSGYKQKRRKTFDFSTGKFWM